MRVVFKYVIPMQNEFAIEMPLKAQILCGQMQRGTPCIWALVDDQKAKEKRMFRLIGTGRFGAESEGMIYIATFQLDAGDLVLHLFNCPSLEQPSLIAPPWAAAIP